MADLLITPASIAQTTAGSGAQSARKILRANSLARDEIGALCGAQQLWKREVDLLCAPALDDRWQINAALQALT